MKKLLKISLSTILAAVPLIASAAEGDYPIQNANGPETAQNNPPKYALVSAASNDGKLATAGYVKGAYNAAIRGVNTVHTNVADLSSNLNSNYAKKVDVAATIDAAKVEGGLDEVALTNAGFTAAPMTASASNATDVGTFEAMTTWNDNTVGTATADSLSVTASNVTVGAKVNGTISATVSGSVSNIDVVDNYASTL